MRGVTRGVGFFVGFALVLSLGFFLHTTQTLRVDSTPPPGEASVGAMTASGECWGNDGKTHPIPSRVWLVLPWDGPGGVQYRLFGPKATDAALRGVVRHPIARFCE
jgi:hypothetical protein